MKCALVPLVFAELYKLLGSESQYSAALEGRLASIYLEPHWFFDAAEAYDAKWRAESQYITGDKLDDLALSEQHAQFASWLLASLHAAGACGPLSSRLETAVLERALNEVSELHLPLPPVLSPTIIGWTLGSVVGLEGIELPVVPAISPSDENVRVAFEGLVEHVLAIQYMREPLPEIMQTAVYWRGYGLAEALRPNEGAGGPALKLLRREALSSMADADRREVGQHLDSFGKRRNALSHIADDPGRPRFVEVVAEVCESSAIALTMRAMTQFVFYDVARDVREQPPSVVRPGAWDTLEREIRVWE